MFRVPRRFFIRDVSLMAACLLPGNPDETFKVKISCKTEDLKSFEDYSDLSQNWQNTNEIIRVNKKFEQKGLLVKSSHSKNPASLEMNWTYHFKNRKSYALWNTEIYFGGLFRRDKIPQEYKYTTIESFV